MMKQIHVLLAATLLVLTSCEKRNDAPVFQAPEYNEVVQIDYEKAQCDLTIQPTSIDFDKYYMLLSTSPDMKDAATIYSPIDSKYSYSYRLDNLTDGKTYYYQYVLQGYFTSVNMDVKSFTTKEYHTPEVITLSPSDITSSACIFYGNVTDGGGLDVSEKGLCYSTNSNPTIDDQVVVCSLKGLGKYSILMDKLNASTTYYVRAYAKNKKGIGYGETISFTTLK